VTVTIGGRPRTFAPPPILCVAIAGVLPLLAVWYLAATVYIVFHDQLLASLITRQTDQQYAYEDQIAGLRTELERETSRGLVDRHTLETTVQALVDRSALLESRAGAIDRLVSRGAKPIEPAGVRARAAANPLLAPDRAGDVPADVDAYSGDSGANPLPRAGAFEKRSERDTPERSATTAALDAPDLAIEAAALDAATVSRIAAALTATDGAQRHALVALREPALKTIARVRLALSEVGVPVTGGGARGLPEDAGGPFVALVSGPEALGFDDSLALSRDALAQADRLAAVVAKVPLRKPLSGPLDVTSPFGARIDPFLGRPAMHTGIDFRESYGDSVRATASGVVTIAGADGGYGTMVEIDHGGGFSTRYAHLSSVSVAPNQKVAAGEVIGHVGSTGRATGPHLHYETRIKGEPVDPTRFLRAGSRIFEE
jgi:murein DD-endopeptidase MepM/ murein hydrolase activator NlpD